MVISQRLASTAGTVLLDDRLVCQYTHMVNSKGFWVGDDPFHYTSPVLMAQIILIFFVTRTTYLLLRPLRQSMIIAQIVAGIIIGPSFLGRNEMYTNKLFPPGGKLILETFAEFGFVIHVFVLGVQMDTSILKRTGRKAMVIGLSSFLFPLALGGSAFAIVKSMTTLDNKLEVTLRFIVAVNSMTSFVVITSLLTDLNILNSELGRLATSTSMVTDACGWLVSVVMPNIISALRSLLLKRLLPLLILLGFYCTIIFVLRPLVILIVRRTPEGNDMKNGHFLVILLIVFGAGFCAEYIGQHAGFAAFILGLALPDGPPLGSILVQKLDTIASALLLPVFCTISGLRTNIYSVEGTRSSVIVELLIVMGYIGKFIGTILSSLYFDIPFWDAVSLALIMSCRGIMEIGIFCLWKDSKIVDNQEFALLIISMVIVTGVATPMVSFIYDPSRRYLAYERRTILHSKQDADPRILVCIHSEDNVATIINLLEASDPTKGRPVSIFVLQLTELTGRASAILAPYHKSNKPASKGNRSKHIVNAFEYYKRHSQGRVTLHHFTVTAPYASMHDDICTLALDERTTLIIVPFHKQWAIDGKVEASFPSIRAVNQNVIDKAPCSVAVLIDRSQNGGKRSVLTGQSLYRIVVLFLGGADDRAALRYGRHMAEHPNISLTVVWFKPGDQDMNSNEEINIDSKVMIDFRTNAVYKERIVYREENVKDGLGTTQVVRSMKNAFDLFIVGRQHDPESPPTLGLTEWSECPELGTLGDMLAASDFRFSVLVVRYQQLGAGLPHRSLTPSGSHQKH